MKGAAKKPAYFGQKKQCVMMPKTVASKARSFHWDELREYTMIDSSRMHDEVYRRGLIEALWRDYHMEIRAYCLARLHEGLAEEVTQEVFVAAWNGLPKYQPEQPLRAWLYGIAHKKCQQMYRNRTRRAEISQMFLEEIREQVHTEEAMTPEQQMAQAGHLKQLQDSLARLPSEERILLNLRYWRDLSMADIASIMGKSVPTLRKRLARAEQRLKEYMQDA